MLKHFLAKATPGLLCLSLCLIANTAAATDSTFIRFASKSAMNVGLIQGCGPEDVKLGEAAYAGLGLYVNTYKTTLAERKEARKQIKYGWSAAAALLNNGFTPDCDKLRDSMLDIANEIRSAGKNGKIENRPIRNRDLSLA